MNYLHLRGFLGNQDELDVPPSGNRSGILAGRGKIRCAECPAILRKHAKSLGIMVDKTEVMVTRNNPRPPLNRRFRNGRLRHALADVHAGVRDLVLKRHHKHLGTASDEDTDRITINRENRRTRHLAQVQLLTHLNDNRAALFFARENLIDVAPAVYSSNTGNKRHEVLFVNSPLCANADLFQGNNLCRGGAVASTAFCIRAGFKLPAINSDYSRDKGHESGFVKTFFLT